MIKLVSLSLVSRMIVPRALSTRQTMSWVLSYGESKNTIPLTKISSFPTPQDHMANESIADLLAVDTSSLERRLLELRRYL